MSIEIKAKELGHLFFVDKFSHVIARDKQGGELRTQSVEALLLLAILKSLQSGKTGEPK